MDSTIVDNPARHRYELMVDGEVAGHVAYTRKGSTLSLTHTEIDPRFEGRGLASVLARGVLDDVRAAGATILPFCPFIRAYLGKHPEYVDLVPPPERDRFALTAPG